MASNPVHTGICLGNYQRNFPSTLLITPYKTALPKHQGKADFVILWPAGQGLTRPNTGKRQEISWRVPVESESMRYPIRDVARIANSALRRRNTKRKGKGSHGSTPGSSSSGAAACCAAARRSFRRSIRARSRRRRTSHFGARSGSHIYTEGISGRGGGL